MPSKGFLSFLILRNNSSLFLNLTIEIDILARITNIHSTTKHRKCFSSAINCTFMCPAINSSCQSADNLDSTRSKFFCKFISLRSAVITAHSCPDNRHTFSIWVRKFSFYIQSFGSVFKIS